MTETALKSTNQVKEETVCTPSNLINSLPLMCFVIRQQPVGDGLCYRRDWMARLISTLRALDSISLLRYVVTTQMQFDFRFSSNARYCLAPKFYFSYCFSVRIFFQSRKRVFQQNAKLVNAN